LFGHYIKNVWRVLQRLYGFPIIYQHANVEQMIELVIFHAMQIVFLEFKHLLVLSTKI